MSNIDKRSVQAVSDLKAGYTLGHADVALLNELARIALASLEAEAVAYLIERNQGVNGVGDARRLVDGKKYNPMQSGYWCPGGAEKHSITPLYTAQPSTVSVPDEKVKGDDFELNGPLSCYQAGKIDGWNECRAAMLQSFGNSEQLNSPVISDGWVACSERMPEIGVDVLACTISPIGGFEEIETAQWHGGMKGEQPVFITSADAIEPTHWQPLPAAPQQEA